MVKEVAVKMSTYLLEETKARYNAGRITISCYFPQDLKSIQSNKRSLHFSV